MTTAQENLRDYIKVLSPGSGVSSWIEVKNGNTANFNDSSETAYHNERILLDDVTDTGNGFTVRGNSDYDIYSDVYDYVDGNGDLGDWETAASNANLNVSICKRRKSPDPT